MAGLNLFGFRPKEDPRPEDEPWPAAVWPIPAEAELRGTVVTLRPLRPADYAELQQALDSPLVWRHLPTPRPHTVADFAAVAEAVLTRGFHPWVLRLSADLDTEFGSLPAGAVVGWSSYLDVAPDDARLEIGNTAYAPPVWGTAVNPEAKLLLLGYAFVGLSMGRVQLKTDIRNVRSQRAIASLGATYEGTLRRYQRRADGTMRDSVLFSVTAEDWPSVRRSLEARVGASSRES